MSVGILNLKSHPPSPIVLFQSHSAPLSRTHSQISILHFTPKYRRRNHISTLKKLSGTKLVPVTSESEGFFPCDAGVYAIYDGNDDLQYVGITRNLSTSILAHKKTVPELCSSVKVGAVEEPDKTALTEGWKSWFQEHLQESLLTGIDQLYDLLTKGLKDDPSTNSD